jgi:hypothetical protein
MPDSIPCPDPTCTAPAQIIDAGPGGPPTGQSSTSRPCAGVATGSRRPLDSLAAEPTAPPLVALAARA